MTLDPVAGADGRLGQADVLSGLTPGQSGVPWAQLAYDAGARINRWEFRWDRIESQPNLWDYSADDPVVRDSRQNGLSVLGILIGTPAWAAAPGQKPGNGVPSGLNRPITDPNNLWAQYVQETVTRYQGQVAAWEIWNEPDLAFFWGGTPAQYLRLLQVAYRTIKSVDPRATVVMGGMVVPGLQFAQQVLAGAQAQGGPPPFDAAAWHIYGSARNAYTNIRNLAALLGTFGWSQTPIWVTEAGFPAANPNGEPRQAAYVLESIVYALAAGASRIVVYRASDDSTGKNWGLVSAQGEPRMGYVAFQVAAKSFAGALGVTYAPTPTVERFTVYRPDSRVTVLWTSQLGDQKLRLPAGQSTSTATDWQGNASPVTAGNGWFHLELPGAAYNQGVDPGSTVVGGPPVLLVEANSPVTGLHDVAALAAPQGPTRQLIVFNPGASPVSVQASAPALSWATESTTIPAGHWRVIDLDLLAGSDFTGLIDVAATAQIQVIGESASEAETAGRGARAWYVPRASGHFTVTNPGTGPLDVVVVADGPNGRARPERRLLVGARQQAGFDVPVQPFPPSLVVRGSRLFLVQGTTSDAGSAMSADWRALLPAGRPLVVFNPGSRSTRIMVHLNGPKKTGTTYMNLRPRHSTDVPTRSSQVVEVVADRPIVADTAGTGGTQPVPATVTGGSYIFAGRTTNLVLFNPSASAARLTLTTATSGKVTSRALTLGARALQMLHVRDASWDPRVVTLSGRTPLDVATGS